MQSIEFEICIDKDGKVQLPVKYYDIYGKKAKMIIQLQESSPNETKLMNPMLYSKKIDWSIDGLEYQKKVRSEWEYIY